MMDLANNKRIDVKILESMNKTSLIMGGYSYNDDMIIFKTKNENFCCEFNVIDNFWTARVTSHIPIKEVPENIKKRIF